jgi:hypothetical protein
MFGRVAPIYSFHHRSGSDRFKHFVECGAGMSVEVVTDERHLLASGVSTFEEVATRSAQSAFVFVSRAYASRQPVVRRT